VEASDENGGPAEARVSEHLALLRTDGPEPSTALVRRIVRSARWQRLARDPVRVVGMIAAAVATGVAAVLGLRRRS
jgi:hypothetical protein